eukprot:3358536-Pleurochrysis_carterae.AAC.1
MSDLKCMRVLCFHVVFCAGAASSESSLRARVAQARGALRRTGANRCAQFVSRDVGGAGLVECEWDGCGRWSCPSTIYLNSDLGSLSGRGKTSGFKRLYGNRDA